MEDCAERRRPLRMQQRAARPLGKFDRHDMLLGGFARRAAISIKAHYDHGGHRRHCHDVSQENGLQERGTTAMRRMEPPHSGQMAKSSAVSARSLLA
jgi:hypothetical protein